MKLKTILGIVATACATLIMSMAVSAATDVKAEGIYENSAGTYIIVPIVITTTDMNNLSGYDITVNYDNSKYTYARLVDSLTYTNEWDETTNYGALGTDNNSNSDGTVTFNWFMNNSDLKFPVPDKNNKIKLAEIWFKAIDNYSENDFTVTEIGNQNEDKWSGALGNINSFFTFDVTGNLGGNEVVALAASTDNGITKQPLEYYTNTNWEEGMDYAAATTTFLVAVDNTQGTDDVTDITIYGELEDGSYIPLSSFDQSDFLVQDFK